MSNYFKTDLLIVGAGPVGIFSAFQAGLLGMSSVIVDALEEIGGQLTALYPLKQIYDIPGFPSILAKDLIKQLMLQAECYNPTYLLNQKVEALNKIEDKFIITTSRLNKIESKAIIIAGGAGAFGPNRLPIEGIEDYEDKTVFYSIKDPSIFKNKTVMVAGGGDSAIDWTLSLCDGVASKVYLVHRRDNFRALPSSLEKLNEFAKTPKLDLLIPYIPKAINGDGEKILEIKLQKTDGTEKFCEIDYLLPFFGLKRDLGGLTKWGLELDKINSTIMVQNGTYESNINGIYVVGDMAKYDHKLKLIMVGFAEATNAIHDSWKYVFPNKPFRFIHSTSRV